MHRLKSVKARDEELAAAANVESKQPKGSLKQYDSNPLVAKKQSAKEKLAAKEKPKSGKILSDSSKKVVEPVPESTDIVSSAPIIENISKCLPISKPEMQQLLRAVNATEDNSEKLAILRNGKTPFLFSSANLSEFVETTPSLKTKIAMICMLAPRLIDPRSKSEYFMSLFRFTEQKAIVEAALKSRMYTLNSAMFSTVITPSDELSSMRSNVSTKRRGGPKFAVGGRGPGIRLSTSELGTISDSFYGYLQTNDITLDSPRGSTDVTSTTPKSAERRLSSILQELSSCSSPPCHSIVNDSPEKRGSLGLSLDNTPSNQYEVGSELWLSILSRRMQRRMEVIGRHSPPSKAREAFEEDFATETPEPDWPSPSQDDQTAVDPTSSHVPTEAVSSSSSTNSTIEANRRATEPIFVRSLIFEPEPKQGWLRKYSREGLFRNWKLRYFILLGGKISYYEGKVSTFVGSNLKGRVVLTRAKVVEKSYSSKEKHRRSFQFCIQSGGEDKDILIECDCAQGAQDWILYIKQHISFASSRSGDEFS